MKGTKKRVFQHVMESDSLKLLAGLLPSEWVIREYKPDYGIDLAVEVFEYTDGHKKVAETLGEHFFVQLKSIEKTTIRKVKVKSRYNVEFTWKPKGDSKITTLDVIKFQIDTPELTTVRAMGAGVPVLLVIVALDLKRAFYVCLNDLIDKVIVPRKPNFHEKDTRVLFVPILNEILSSRNHLVPIRFYAKRAKLLAAFNKIAYQRSRLAKIQGSPFDFQETVAHFASLLLDLDVWNVGEMWRIVSMYEARLWLLRLRLTFPLASDELAKLPDEANRLWDGLALLGSNFEEVCREWCLPTSMAQLWSYPDGEANTGRPMWIRAAKLMYPEPPDHESV